MKRTLTMLTIVLLTGAFLYACGIIPNSDTSFVTIRIGDRSGTAVLQAEAATPWARMKHVLAGVKLMPEAQAYIPSVVQVIIVTVTAADISTPIVGVDSINDTDTVATVRIEVPNGAARQFLVEGYRGLPSGATQLFYSGTASSDLSGMDITLPVTMALVGPGIYVDFNSGNDSTGTGTASNPFKTITRALSATSGTDALFVAPGTYPPAGAAAGESYPLQLRPHTALICTGAGFSTILDLGSFSTTAIYGNEGASIDNCMFRINNSGGGAIAINDAIGGQPGQQSRIRVNGSSVILSGFPTGLANIGVILNDDSLLLETSVTGSAAGGTLTGVRVQGGRPSIIGNTISSLPYGIRLEAGANDAVIGSNIIESNQYGIWITSSSSPKIDRNTIKLGSTGIYASGGIPEITNNDINNNSLGIDVEIGSGVPRIQGNRLYCSSIADFFTNLSTQLDIRGNAWDHDLTTTPSGTYGPTDMTSNNGAFGCSSGVDICYQDTSPQPNYTSILPAVPNGCRVP